MRHTDAAITRRLVAAAIAAALTLTACGGGGDAEPVAEAVAESAAESAGDSPSFGLATAERAAALADDPSITVIDVRTPEEYDEGHIEGATLIDFYSDTFVDEIATLDRDQEYLIYCRSGNRSGQAFAIMADLGFTAVHDLDGGVIAWDAAGLDLVP